MAYNPAAPTSWRHRVYMRAVRVVTLFEAYGQNLPVAWRREAAATLMAESGGRRNRSNKNKNGTEDLGIAMYNFAPNQMWSPKFSISRTEAANPAIAIEAMCRFLNNEWKRGVSIEVALSPWYAKEKRAEFYTYVDYATVGLS